MKIRFAVVAVLNNELPNFIGFISVAVKCSVHKFDLTDALLYKKCQVTFNALHG
ncbi:hypothetical protein SDC9_113244 [bioreactor metagenome]|uniref:Uncharacterized protein n=1 Tax=bioreactor metagenome TaxID=1076179 RepID=A0A645BM80_9ZZZZ